jgi:uncharacterized protein
LASEFGQDAAMMILRFCFLWLLLLAGPAFAVPALWQVSNGKGGTITLLGTIHMLPTPVQFGDEPPVLPWLSPVAKAAFTEADMLIVETVLPQNQAVQRAAQERLGRLPTPVPVAARLPARLRPKLGDIVDGHSLSPARMAMYEDWALAMSLAITEINLVGLDPASGADRTLMAMARAARKPVAGLEPLETALHMLNAMPPAAQRAALVLTVERLSETGTLVSKAHTHWQSGDLKSLSAVLTQDHTNTKDLDTALIRDRNRAWVERIVTMFTGNQRLFMAVGARHMLDPGNLIPMLEARGFTVKRIE